MTRTSSRLLLSRIPGKSSGIYTAARALLIAGAVTTLILSLSYCRITQAAIDSRQVERGRYLVSIMGCHDCHTPWIMTERGPEPDMTRMLSGHPGELAVTPAVLSQPWAWAGTDTNTAYSGPWGISFAANLTPDENTGLGTWTEEIFIQTIRNGRHWGVSRPILPPMPWQVYRNMTDRDIKAVFAYLRTIPAIKNEVPQAIVNEPLDDVEAIADGAAQ